MKRTLLALSYLCVVACAAPEGSTSADSTASSGNANTSGDPTSASSTSITTAGEASSGDTSGHAGDTVSDASSSGAGSDGSSSDSGVGTTGEPAGPGICTLACDGNPLVCCGGFACNPSSPGENFACTDGECVPIGCESDDHCTVDGAFFYECHPFLGVGVCGTHCETEGEACMVHSNPGTCVADDAGGVFCRNQAFACTGDDDCEFSGGHCDLEHGTCYCMDDDECSSGLCS